MTDADLTSEMIDRLRCEAVDCDDVGLAALCESVLRGRNVTEGRRHILRHINAVEEQLGEVWR